MKNSHRRPACFGLELRSLSCLICVYLCSSVALLSAADVETRQLTHYVPQDALEVAVRTENWTEVPLAVKGGVRKGEVVRVWGGGRIDRGNGEQPGEKASGHDGIDLTGDRNEERTVTH